MPDQKYTADPHLVVLTGAESFPIATGSADYYTTPADVKTYVFNAYGGQTSIQNVGTIGTGTWAGDFQPRITSIPSTATISPNPAITDIYIVTTLGVSTVINPITAGANPGRKLEIRIKDNGTAQGISYGANIRFNGITPLLTTTVSRTVYLGMEFNFIDNIYDVLFCTDSIGKTPVFASLTAAKSGIPLGSRSDGLTVMITGVGEYWWLAADLTDTGLIVKASPGLLPPVDKIYNIVGTSADAAREGGAANNYYGGSTAFQNAYNAALTFVTSSPVRVCLNFGVTCGANASTSLVGGLVLAADWNINICVNGINPAVSVLGIIDGTNASGAGRSINAIFFYNVLLLGANLSATGASGNSGSMTGGSFLNCVLGSINTSITNAANTTGTGGAVSVLNVPSAGFPRFGTSHVLGPITTSAQGAVPAGFVTFLNCTISGPVTSAISPNTGGFGIFINCLMAGAFSCNSSTIFTHTFQGCTASNVTTQLNLTLADGAQVVIDRSSVNLNTLTLNGTGATQPIVNISNSTVYSLSSATNTHLKIKWLAYNSYIKFVATALALNTIGENSSIINSVIDRDISGGDAAFPTIKQIGVGCEFINSTIINNGTQSASGTIGNSSNVSVKFIGSRNIVGRPTLNVSLIGDEDVSQLISTTDATVTTIFTIPIPTGQRCKITANVEATSGTNVLNGQKYNIIRNDAGTLTKVSGTDISTIPIFQDAGLSGATFVLAISGTNLLVQVTGLVATNINWTATIKTSFSF